jgi:hypothetical protein
MHWHKLTEAVTDLERLQETTVDRCSSGDKAACVSGLYLELFRRALQEGNQLRRLVEDTHHRL